MDAGDGRVPASRLLGKRLPAVASKNEAISGNAAAANKRGLAHWQAGDVAKGIECFREAVARTPDALEYRLTLAEALNQLDRWQEAEGILAEALALAPNDQVVQTAIMRAYQGLGRGDDLL